MPAVRCAGCAPGAKKCNACDEDVELRPLADQRTYTHVQTLLSCRLFLFAIGIKGKSLISRGRFEQLRVGTFRNGGWLVFNPLPFQKAQNTLEQPNATTMLASRATMVAEARKMAEILPGHPERRARFITRLNWHC